MIKPLSCPICNQDLPPSMTQSSPTFPFCSERCRNVDMFRWCEGKYAIVENIDDRPDLADEYIKEVEAGLEEDDEDDVY